jgi:hypothetical protein
VVDEYDEEEEAPPLSSFNPQLINSFMSYQPMNSFQPSNYNIQPQWQQAGPQHFQYY